jgi:calcium-dependent protein kinase
VRPLNTPVKEEFELSATELGSGSTAIVVMAYIKHCGNTPRQKRLIALKTVSKQGLSKTREAQLTQEVSIHLKLQHPSIARLLRVVEGPRFLHIATELCSGGCLTERLRGGRLQERAVAQVVRQVLQALSYCHEHPAGKVCHRDIKHTNILYASEDEGLVKLIDFGLSGVLSPEKPWLTGRVGTLGYMAPEVVWRQRYNESCDLFSVGVVAFTLLSGKYPYDVTSFHHFETAVTVGPPAEATGPAWADVSDEARGLVTWLLDRDPLRRPTATQVLRHPWLEEASQEDSFQPPPFAEESAGAALSDGKAVVQVSGSTEGGKYDVVDVEMSDSTCTPACSADAEDTFWSSMTSGRRTTEVTPRFEAFGAGPPWRAATPPVSSVPSEAPAAVPSPPLWKDAWLAGGVPAS